MARKNEKIDVDILANSKYKLHECRFRLQRLTTGKIMLDTIYGPSVRVDTISFDQLMLLQGKIGVFFRKRNKTGIVRPLRFYSPKGLVKELLPRFE